MLVQRVIGQEDRLPHHHPRSRTAQVLRRAQRPVRAQGAGLPEPDPDLDGRQDARSRRRPPRRRPRTWWRGRARARNSANWRAPIPTTRKRRATAASLLAYRAGMLQKQIEDVVFKEKKGYVTDPIKRRPGLRDSAGGRALRGGPGVVRRSAGARSRTWWPRPQMEPKVRAFLTQLRQEAFLRNQGRLRG